MLSKDNHRDETILISIIVPVYNVAKYLEQCVNSILSQSFQNWELLLIDDGSTDGSGLLCDCLEKKDCRISSIHKDNGGASDARNLGILVSRGEWITFIDSDDFVGQDYLRSLSSPLFNGSDVDFVHGGCSNYKGGTNTTVNQVYDSFVDTDKIRLFQSFRGLVVSKLFNSKIIKDNNLSFDTQMKIAEDMAFTLDYLYYVNHYAFVDTVEYYYRRDNCNSATHIVKHLSYYQERVSFLHLYDSTFSYIKKYGIPEGKAFIRLQQRANQYFQMLRSMYYDKELSRRDRIDLVVENNSQYHYLLSYCDVEDRYSQAVGLLMNNHFQLFDKYMWRMEFINKIKERVKQLFIK